ncbi:MAG: 3-isopropylmalate dehydratase small subunit [Alphaproteobacteria bacterium]|nr:3-isopropylmalate dehydratase small subunit [Alphaproteobacteria bacterium]
MQAFTTHSGIAAPLPLVNIDTDMLISKEHLKTIKRTGLGIHLFGEMRYLDNGDENPNFVLNQDAFRKASILVAGDNFGCGSSREHAPWALLDFGIRSIIAPSFADIFYNNCFKNGILPIALPEANVKELMHDSTAHPGNYFTIDLDKQTVISPSGKSFSFDIDAFRKHCLINGLDDIGLTLQKADEINAYEAKYSQISPWLFNSESK